MDTRKALDAAYNEAETASLSTIEALIEPQLLNRLKSWKYGSYGWTSPVNIILTCAWYKWLHPNQDICRIWPNDHNGSPIPGSFPCRTQDEKFTVPLVTKTNISSGFCSPNSGLQGTRAIEKMRGSIRLERNAPIEQKVLFDMDLLQNILNDINDGESSEAYSVFQWLLKTGMDIRDKRLQSLKSIAETQSIYSPGVLSKLLDFASKIQDPQFVKAVAIVVFEHFIHHFPLKQRLSLEGVEGSKTAADARSGSPGDFWYIDKQGVPIIGVEVKDSTKKVGFQILRAVEARKERNPTLRYYYIIAGSHTSIDKEDRNDDWWNKNLTALEKLGVIVCVISLFDLMALAQLNDDKLEKVLPDLNLILSKTSDLKPTTLTKWKAFIDSL